MSELTREQVEELLEFGKDMGSFGIRMLAHDAALRQRVEALEKWIKGNGMYCAVSLTGDPDDVEENPPSIEQCQKVIVECIKLGEAAHNKANNLTTKLAACEQERDLARKEWSDEHDELVRAYANNIELDNTIDALQRQLQQREEDVARLKEIQKIDLQNNNEYRQQVASQRARFDVLEGALKSIEQNTCCERCNEAALVARNALSATREKDAACG